jgi:hypothetical protein
MFCNTSRGSPPSVSTVCTAPVEQYIVQDKRCKYLKNKTFIHLPCLQATSSAVDHKHFTMVVFACVMGVNHEKTEPFKEVYIKAFILCSDFCRIRTEADSY